MELWRQIQEAGIVGCGGAGFPTHIKYQSKAGTLIINGAECEPLLRSAMRRKLSPPYAPCATQ